MKKTCEFVSPKHPDKICDFIADSILDTYLAQDPDSRVAVEVMGGHGVVNVSGEITSRARVDIKSVVQAILGDNYLVGEHLSRQSEAIATGVDGGGAGDQGIMIGYACNETATLMPYEYELARHLCRVIYGHFPYDGKVQVTLDGSHIITVVASFQNAPHDELENLLRRLVKADTYFVNPAGDWTLGGLDADSGLSGRKLVVDAYGPNVPIGGGSFSGKDYTKVDRSGAYMARKIAVDLLKYHHSQEIMVKLAYVIGIAEPVMALAIIDGEDHDLLSSNYLDYDLSPKGIRLALGLDNYDFADFSTWGHFGRHDLGTSWC